jgi:long-subunit acyl-CoA synthetase (AMP-forming)
MPTPVCMCMLAIVAVCAPVVRPQGTRAVLPPPEEGKPADAGDFQWMTYAQAQGLVENLGSALVRDGFIPPQSEGVLPVVGIFSRNRAEWVIGQQACYSYGYTVVPLYSTLGTEAVR